MEQLLKKRNVHMMRSALDKTEECPINAEYTLPEYCPDIAVVLKCYAYPRVQNRQWSGDQLLLDGSVVIRVLYLDEGRHCLHAAEFAEGFACTFRSDIRPEHTAVELDLSSKYMNCRAIGPRRLEVRGAVVVRAQVDCEAAKECYEASENMDLYTKTTEIPYSVPCGVAEKISGISEILDFPQNMPPAEMLLGGECRAVVRECKLLVGKAIVKGCIYLHQTYTDATDGEHIYCLDYELPFSQILDIDGASEGMLCAASVQVLTDTERCVSGDDGLMSALEATVKILVQCRVFDTRNLSVLRDAYHSRYPVSLQSEMMSTKALLSANCEETTVMLHCHIPAGGWSEILDICLCILSEETESRDGRVCINGRMSVSVIARDMDGEIVHDEFIDTYSMEFPTDGNEALCKSSIASYTYRTVDDKLELQVRLLVDMRIYHSQTTETIVGALLQTDAAYPTTAVSALLYYGAAGEDVWDIGKCCHTSPDSIVEENRLNSMCLDTPTVLFVPL